MDPEPTKIPISLDAPVILLHGWGMHASVFDSLRERLSDAGAVVCADLPGYGDHPWQPGLSFEEQAAQLADRYAGSSLVGWSLGGLYATEMLRQFPGRYSQLVLVSSNPCFVRRADWPCAVAESVFDNFAEDLAGGWSSTLRRFLTLQMLGDPDARRLVRDLLVKFDSAGEPCGEVLRFGLELLKSVDMREVLAELDLPVKLILGRRDALVPVSLAKEILKLNPRIRVESIASAAHAPFLSHPDQFVSLL